MKERGIIMQGHSVRAILEGRKTMTRRPVKLRYPFEIEERDDGTSWPWYPEYVTGGDWDGWVPCPYGQPGDRLWVRETWCMAWDDENDCWPEPERYHYRADGYEVVHVDGGERSPWKPSIHMPRRASRITLEVTDVRVERLHDIGERDAFREGLVQLPASGRFAINKGDQYFGGASHDAREVFSWLWESINGAGSWDANPHVWIVEFKRVTP